MASPVVLAEQPTVPSGPGPLVRQSLSRPLELAVATVTIHQKLGADHIEITIISGTVVFRRQLVQPGPGITSAPTSNSPCLRPER